jgi:hypothetical protein
MLDWSDRSEYRAIRSSSRFYGENASRISGSGNYTLLESPGLVFLIIALCCLLRCPLRHLPIFLPDCMIVVSFAWRMCTFSGQGDYQHV